MTQNTIAHAALRTGTGLLAGLLLIGVGSSVLAQSSNGTGNAATVQPPSSATSSATATQRQARARLRAARRRARAAAAAQAAQQKSQAAPAVSTQVGPTPAQRRRDAQILAAQKAQSNASAKENDALTQKVIADRQKQQAEPRIQDAPGPDSTPLPGQPIVPPAASEASPIQDAPGPAQTLPKAPPPADTSSAPQR